jgi:hypothetical protein
LDVSLRKAVIDALGKIQCRGEQAYKTAYLVGAGAPVPLYTALSVARTSATDKMKYYQTSSDEAKQQLLQKNLHYGITSNGLSDDWHTDIPDVALMPSAVYAFVPGTCRRVISDQLGLFGALTPRTHACTHSVQPREHHRQWAGAGAQL